jgi:hypothetical protein
MFDFRYHVVSLAAVFLALVIGILVGVGLSSSSLKESDRKLLDAQLASVQHDLDQARTNVADLQQAQRAADAVAEQAYPLVMRGRLRGKHIAVLSIGGLGGVGDDIERALQESGGALPPLRVRALKVPVDPQQLDAVLAQRPAFAKYVGDDRLDELGRALAEEFVTGGDTPLWQALSGMLVSERSGSAQLAADGVVVVRSTRPQQGPTARFLTGLYAGLRGAGIPVVGVETSAADTSAVPAYRHAGLSSVDDVDGQAGRLALALVLAGAQPGHFGLKATASDGVLPPLRALPRSSGTGG